MSQSSSRKSAPSERGFPKRNTMLALFRQAFAVKNNPFPYWKAFRAGLASSLPVFIGLMAGRMDYGLLASLGGFTYLYVFNQPYVERARRIFFVMLGLALCVVLGTLLAPYPIGAAALMGVVVAVPLYIFGSLRIAGPSAIFFILTYAMATGMPVDPSLAPLRGGLVLLGGALSWILCMLGWFVDPRGPETQAIKRVYSELTALVSAIGTEDFLTARHRAVQALKNAEDILMGGYRPAISSDSFKRLFLLNERANAIFLEILELSERNQNPAALSVEQEALIRKIRRAGTTIGNPSAELSKELTLSRPSLRMIFLGTFDKNSIVFLTAVRSGVVVAVAAILAVSFPFERSYWIPLSCASVLAGSNFIGTFHRAVQRTVGTVVGLLLAGVILATVHNGYAIVLLILLLTFLTETFIVRNYGIAAMFFTPAALVMAEYSTQRFEFGYFASVRLVDILLGSLIGLLGTILIGRRLATSLVHHFIAKSIRSLGYYLLRLFSPGNERHSMNDSIERTKVQTNLINLQSVYNTSLGELHGSKERLEALWPVLFSIEQLGYYLDACSKSHVRPELSDEKLSRYLYLLETMAMAVDHNLPLKLKEVPVMEGYSKISNEIGELQKALHLRTGAP